MHLLKRLPFVNDLACKFTHEPTSMDQVHAHIHVHVYILCQFLILLLCVVVSADIHWNLLWIPDIFDTHACTYAARSCLFLFVCFFCYVMTQSADICRFATFDTHISHHVPGRSGIHHLKLLFIVCGRLVMSIDDGLRLSTHTYQHVHVCICGSSWNPFI